MVYVVDGCEKIRLDVYLTEETDYTRSYIKKLTEQGNILLNDVVVSKSGSMVKSGDVITLNIPPIISTIVAQDLPIDIIYQDEDIAVINKRQGMTVHPAPGNYENTLVNALMFHLKDLSSINGELRPGIVHRLDKDTSGVIVVAKNNDAHLHLSKQLADRNVKKHYYGLVHGNFKEKSGRIQTMIGRSLRDRKMMAVVADGRNSITDYEVMESYTGYDFVKFDLLTGRTHQIRVHSKYVGHPLIGDKTYGHAEKFNTVGQLLHSHDITFTHPRTKELVAFEAPVPEHFTKIFNIIKNTSR